MQAVTQGVWASAEAYEPYMGRWSRQIARQFIAWLARPPGVRWIDVGSGTGAVIQAIVEHAQPAAVVALDRSADYLAYAQAHHSDPRVTFRVGDGAKLEDAAATFDVATSGLVLNFTPDASAILREMARVTRPGGLVAAYMWDYGGRMELLRCFWDVAVQLNPSVRSRDEANRSEVWRPEVIERLMRKAGLADVAVEPIEIQARFADFDTYWAPFRGGQGTVASYAMGLDEAARAELCTRLAAHLPRAADSAISLALRVWAARGSVR